MEVVEETPNVESMEVVESVEVVEVTPNVESVEVVEVVEETPNVESVEVVEVVESVEETSNAQIQQNNNIFTKNSVKSNYNKLLFLFNYRK